MLKFFRWISELFEKKTNGGWIDKMMENVPHRVEEVKKTMAALQGKETSTLDNMLKKVSSKKKNTENHSEKTRE